VEERGRRLNVSRLSLVITRAMLPKLATTLRGAGATCSPQASEQEASRMCMPGCMPDNPLKKNSAPYQYIRTEKWRMGWCPPVLSQNQSLTDDMLVGWHLPILQLRGLSGPRYASKEHADPDRRTKPEVSGQSAWQDASWDTWDGWDAVSGMRASRARARDIGKTASHPSQVSQLKIVLVHQEWSSGGSLLCHTLTLSPLKPRPLMPYSFLMGSNPARWSAVDNPLARPGSSPRERA
jgi:hypothetical protein